MVGNSGQTTTAGGRMATRESREIEGEGGGGGGGKIGEKEKSKEE